MKNTVGEEEVRGKWGGLHKAIQTTGATYTKRKDGGEWWGRNRGWGQNTKKEERLVMSMLSVTSFVDSHCVAMTTVKSLLEEQFKALKLHLF